MQMEATNSVGWKLDEVVQIWKRWLPNGGKMKEIVNGLNHELDHVLDVAYEWRRVMAVTI